MKTGSLARIIKGVVQPLGFTLSSTHTHGTFLRDVCGDVGGGEAGTIGERTFLLV